MVVILTELNLWCSKKHVKTPLSSNVTGETCSGKSYPLNEGDENRSLLTLPDEVRVTDVVDLLMVQSALLYEELGGLDLQINFTSLLLLLSRNRCINGLLNVPGKKKR
jgi:hypothetical protein